MREYQCFVMIADHEAIAPHGLMYLYYSRTIFGELNCFSAFRVSTINLAASTRAA